MTQSKLPLSSEHIAIIVIAFLGIVVAPYLNTLPPTSWLYISDFTLNLWGKYLTLAILAISVDLLWGYTGLLSLGQSLFFILGGYAFGMYLMLQIGVLGQSKSELPDFMVFLGYTQLPWFWRASHSFWFSVLAALWVPALVALVFGYLAFRSRIKGVYFSILTQALTYAACLMFFRNDTAMGGNNGFTDFKLILGYDIRAPETQRALYIITATTLLLIYLGCRWLTSTKFGKVQQAIRDSENRVLFSGYSTVSYKLFIFVLSSMIAGIGGMLYVPQVGIINPSDMAPDKSLEAVVWVAVGGRGTLVGPIVGAVSVNALRSYSTTAFPEYWLFLQGLVFILVVLFLPKGLVGLWTSIVEYISKQEGGLRGVWASVMESLMKRKGATK
ncbi:urea ABC transporter permease subunit UrtC [Verrucomicrobia bacterium LW23]|nr:urea ABC transporter permease subunit UrtC [Verrucomicrobia bacterium LW23]